MKTYVIAAVVGFAVLSASPAIASPASHDGKEINELMVKEFPDLPGKEGLMLTVTFPPGGADEVHRHDALAFVYVLEGSIVMQVKGSPPVTLKPGQAFYEGPTDIHLVGRNASPTKPARFVVFIVKDKGAPAVKPVK
jgi:quercetin dioxygenase-like cupin family protein